ncbi:oligoendopeptidase F [Natranaeroarchaeum sulfidigenes]|uniref:Oligoendopeptidase F n=1 Tax=Natranaeroarchaeum sulfidigenes TaxID=2784880 RepID=A0A897MRJ5_9EURY|nr:oligoendopeptidase F [Natranaeroarchaeum sulfidigenes]QSG01643.1 Oligoendopeptidase F [Natranaeroarchaeum sulfidigenes]
MSSVPDRSEIDEEYKWDLESIYATDEEWEAAYETVEERIDDLASYEGQVVEDGTILLEFLELYESVMRDVQQIAAYARMRRDEDTRDQEYQAMTTRSQSLAADASSAASFLEPELQSLDDDELDALIDSEPELDVYEHYIDDVVRMREHTRSAEIEGLLADLSEVTGASGEIYNILTNADVEFPTVEDPDGEAVEISLANFTNLQKDPDREFRREVYEQFYDEWEGIRNTVATSYRNSVKADVKLARARNYETAREAAMDGPNVPVEVYDNLVETVRDNLDKVHRHAELKRRALDVDELRMWDLYMPMTETESPDLEYEQAREHVVEALGALGEEYQSRVAEGLDSRWVDVYENRGKQSGAYSGGTYDTQPFILMNYQDDVSSMFTLAHELGHSMHSQYTSENQPYVYSSYEIFTAEVASTVNESLLTRHLLDTVEDPQLRRHILNEYLERFRSTLYRQTMFADFEHRAHEIVEDGGALTPDRLDELYGDLKAEFYEPAAIDDRIAREWMRIPHFYRAYYVYQYSTGISAAVALANSIVEEGQPAVDRYLGFLEQGSRQYPLELLADAGVDMSSPDPIEAALSTYDEHLAEFEALL